MLSSINKFFIVKIKKNKRLLLFLCIISFFTSFLFWQVFIQNKIPFSANLLASAFNPWSQEKFPNWEVGIPNKPTGKDDLWIFYPQRTLTTYMLRHWEIPFWNPYSFSGNYHLGLSETAVFYPLNFLFLFFSQINTWVFLTVIEPIIAGIGMYLFLKKIVKHEKSAILGGLSFAFSGIVIVRSVEGLSVGHALIWIGYVFWGIELFFQTKRTKFLFLILLFLFLSLLAGWFQFTFYILAFSLAYALYRIFDLKGYKKFYFLVLIPFCMLPFVTLFHTLPAMQALFDSPRSTLEGRVFSFYHLMPIAHIFTLVFPDFWGNPAVYNYFGKTDYKESILFITVIPLILSLISIFKQKSKKELFFLGAIASSFVIAFENPVSKLFISLPLPVFNSFIPDRIFLITTFSFCVLAAFGQDYLLGGKINEYLRNIKKTFILLWFIVAGLILFTALRVMQNPNVLHQVNKVGIGKAIEIIQIKSLIIPIIFLLLATVIFFGFKKKYSKNIFFFIIILVLFLQGYFFGQKYIPFSYREFVYPDHPVFTYLKQNQGLNRFMSVGYGHILPSIPLQFNLYSPEGVSSMYVRRYGEFVRYMKLGNLGIIDKIAFNLDTYPKEVFSSSVINQRLERFFALTSVKYIVVDKKSMEETKISPNKNNFQLVWKNEKWQIYQYLQSMPRFFITSNFEVLTNKYKILQSLFSNSFKANKIILEENPGFQSKSYQGNLKIIQYSPNTIKLDVSTNQPTLVYFSDNYTKAFNVFIDGKKGKLLRANYTFRAIPVLKGKHTIIISYDSKGVFFGFLIALVSLIIATVILFRCRKCKGLSK